MYKPKGKYMNKKSTLLAAALMAVSSFTANAEDLQDKFVPAAQWTAGNYYYIKTIGGDCLSLYGLKADSVVITNFGSESVTADKIASRDSALWEITPIKVAKSDVVYYQIKNKKTKAILSFDPQNGAPVLAEGANMWSITDEGLSAKLSDNKELKLYLKGGDGKDKKAIVFNGETPLDLKIYSPEYSIPLTADYINLNFNSFKLSFGGTYKDNLFEGKDLIIESTGDEDWVTMQIEGDESFADGKAKYIGIDTLSVSPSGAKGAFGAVFKLDSIYKKKDGIHTIGNENFQQFKFKINLRNDSLAMYVLGAPNIEEKLKDEVKYPRIVYVSLDNTKILTVGDPEVDNVDPYKGQGDVPFISIQKDASASIDKGTGVYFLKSASKGKDAGKYIKGYDQDKKELILMDGTPSVNFLEGQWFVKSESGLYSIVDRATNTNILLKGEVFAVKGMSNTYTFGASTDSITVEYKNVDLNNKHLGSLNLTAGELADNGYVLNLVPESSTVSDLYAYASESILKIKSGEAKDAVIFKLVPIDSMVVGGAKALKDTISVISYKLNVQFSNESIIQVDGANNLKLSKTGDASEFQFVMNATGDKYSMKVTGEEKKYVSSDINTSNMIISDNIAYFKLEEVEAPEYVSLKSSHKRFTATSLDLSLVMNPLNFYAEAKREGLSILKSDNYEKDNFSLWVSKSDASTPGKSLYYICTSLQNEQVKAEKTLYYLVSGRDSIASDESLKVGNYYRVNFIDNDTIDKVENNAALFAFKTTEDGYLLENQKELTRTLGANEIRTPYLGVKNGVVLMMEEGVPFEIETVSGPVANEEIEAPNTIKVIGGVGEFSIRNAHGKKITVSNILGQTIGTRVVSSDYVTIPTARGVVIVSVEGDQAYKVIVK